MTDGRHIPVMLNESTEYLITDPVGNYLDGTIGFGGHSSRFLQIMERNSALIGVDKDDEAYGYCKDLFKNEPRIKLYRTGFKNIDVISKIEFIDSYTGIFADLGVSSYQLDNADSGFSYRFDAKLDLRMNKSEGVPAFEIVNDFSEEELADIIFNFGEERKSRLIARNIVKERLNKKIESTGDLKRIVEHSVPKKNLNKTLSRVFQAFRIYVNDELEELKEFLEKSVELLKEKGRIVILTYHSLEDRIVKEFFNYESLDCVCPPEIPVCVCEKEKRLKVLTKKAVMPSDEEIENNPRARSAKLRAAEKV
ncbi:MAG: 16S rRNA (cytosine(1402)-N(4))-methyltransferase RsmH [Ignavibacteria bacterium]|jgi:16S rRNA (cytosine1402-N4)-methyltransferase